MKISFDNMQSQNVDKVTTVHQVAAAGAKKAGSGCALDISGIVTDNTAYGIVGNKARGFQTHKNQGVHGRTAEEVMQTAGAEDITLYRNYMTVMSNSMSAEDFAKLQKEGINPNNTEIETAVTIVDTIKAELLKSGVNIAGYTDDVNMDVLTQITGSVSFANHLKEAFVAEDLPLTEENVTQAMEAFHRGQELTELSEGTTQYMVTNEMEPTIDDFYLAEHAGAIVENAGGKGYYSEELPGYYSEKASDADVSKLQKQIEQVISKAGYEVTPETIEKGMWLVKRGIPVTTESLTTLNEIEDVKLPATENDLFSAIAAAMTEGKSAGEANLTEKKSIYRKAAESYISYEQAFRDILLAEPTLENIKKRSQLEEVRLHMTVEANVKLLESGFSIDTAPIEETIDALKQLKEEHMAKLKSNPITTDLFTETIEKTKEIPYFPAATTARLLKEGQAFTVDSVWETGQSVQKEYAKAGEAYETMMTTPRGDMGDSIKTAFQNVDEILQNMGVELTDDNRKALRSISYNHMELTEEMLLKVKGADKTVQRVVEKMTPTAVLDLIRKGVNPLTTSMEELDTFLSERDTYEEDSTKYSQFLYQLEQNKEITSEEKESYIGIYRLLRQIEKSDGAAIGKLVDTKAEVNFENLLSAVRTGKLQGVDVSVNEEFGGLKEAVEKGISIDTQIETAFESTRLKEARSVNKVSDDAIRFLKQLEQPVTIDNLLAADTTLKEGVAPFKKIRQLSVTANLAFSISEEATADKAHFEEAYGDFIEETKEIAKTVSFSSEIGSIDIRAMQTAYKQLHLQGLRGLQEEEYDLPQIIDGELTAIHLKLVHDSKNSGQIAVSVDFANYGTLSGEFSLGEGVVSGMFTGMGEEAISYLKNTVEQLTEGLQEAGFTPKDIKVIEGNLHTDTKKAGGTKEETKRLYQLAGVVIIALNKGNAFTSRIEENHEN